MIKLPKNLVIAIKPDECTSVSDSNLAQLNEQITKTNAILSKNWIPASYTKDKYVQISITNKSDWLVVYLTEHFRLAGWTITKHSSSEEDWLQFTKNEKPQI